MPKKLIVVLAFVAISVVLNALSEAWLALVFNLAIGAALYKGHEGIRTLLMWTSAIGAVAYIVLFGLSVVGALALGFSGLVLLALASTLFGLIQCVFTVLALRDSEVQQWMYARSMGGGYDDPSAF